MLPFLKPDKMVGVIVARRKENGSTEPLHEEGSLPPELMAAAEDLLRGLSAKDSSAVASALQAAFQISDSMPHVEGEHE